MLNYNSTDPEHIKARQNVVLLSVNEAKEAVKLISLCVFGDIDYPVLGIEKEQEELIQRFIHDYENKSHFYTVTGGWEGVTPEWISLEINGFPERDYAMYHVITKKDVYCKEPKNIGIEEFWGDDAQKEDWWRENVLMYCKVETPKLPDPCY